MSQLIVYRGDHPITAEPTNEPTYVYRIGGGSVYGCDLIELNDAVHLNRVAEDLRGEYCSWIFSLNYDLFKERLMIDRLSLFFLTDLSCKRTEFFDTFDMICNLVLIRNLLVGIDISTAKLIGVDKGFVCGFKSIFPRTTIVEENLGHPATTKMRRVFADLWYLLRLAGVALSNGRIFNHRENYKRTEDKFYFSYYPQMFFDNGRDSKYGRLVTGDDRYAVSIVTDGIHQKIATSRYFRSRKKIESEGNIVIDRFVRIVDSLWGLYWVIRCQWFLFKIRKTSFVFNDIDITGVVAPELYFSMSRIARLCAISRAFIRFFKFFDIKEFIYYPHEYPFGRMISYIAKITRPEMHRRGYQMGPVSERRMEVFMADGEARRQPPFFEHVPIPDSVAAEDDLSAQIYRRCGYENVEVMDTIYRYSHIENLELEKRKGWVLLVPGLHDAGAMLDILEEEINRYPEKTYILKLHPRSKKSTVGNQWYYEKKNVKISQESVGKWLGIVEEVFVTYSSVGIEAEKLGLSITIVNIPGKINTSPLLDKVGKKSESIKEKSPLIREFLE